MLRTTVTALLMGAALALTASPSSFAQGQAASKAPASSRHKVVFQVSDGDAGKWNLALNNIKNMQKDLGKENLDIELVTYGPGIGMLKRESEVGPRVQEALETGVRIVACENTMRGQHLTKEDMLPNVGYVPSGVVELMKKQEAGYSYMRP